MSSLATTTSRFFQALGDPTRLRIAALLARPNQRACVCELCDALAERQYNVSRHLKILQAAGLVTRARAGRWVYYQLAALPGPFRRHLTALLQHLPKDTKLALDRERFAKRLALRRDGRCCVWVLSDAVA